MTNLNSPASPPQYSTLLIYERINKVEIKEDSRSTEVNLRKIRFLTAGVKFLSVLLVGDPSELGFWPSELKGDPPELSFLPFELKGDPSELGFSPSELKGDPSELGFSPSSRLGTCPS